MSKGDNGGPAFPVQELHMDGSPYALSFGITVRDYFAAHAPEVPADFGWANGERSLHEVIVRWRYFYADAMLQARAI